MSREEAEDTTTYKVVVNHEEQYSIWPVDRENARGWMDAGKSGLKAECLGYIKEVWTDMRPLSLRKRMEQDALLVVAEQLFPRDDKQGREYIGGTNVKPNGNNTSNL